MWIKRKMKQWLNSPVVKDPGPIDQELKNMLYLLVLIAAVSFGMGQL